MATKKTRTRGIPSSFQEGDVVTRLRSGVSLTVGATIGSGTIGTICKVVTPGRTYRVVYDDFDLCVPVFHDALALAADGTEGPDCPEDC